MPRHFVEARAAARRRTARIVPRPVSFCRKRNTGRCARRMECERRCGESRATLLRWTLALGRSTVSPVFARAAIVLLLTVSCCLAQQPTPSVVYVAHDAKAVKDYKTNPAIVRELVDRVIMAVTGQPDVAKAWGSLVAPSDRIGIKISAAGGELFTTHRDVVNAIVEGLVAAGHARGDIIVWDRSLGGIKEAGYRPEKEGYQLKSVSPREGYDPKAVFTAPLTGKLIWGDLEFRSGRGKIPFDSEQELTSDNSH